MNRYYPNQLDGNAVMGSIESGEPLLLVAGRPPLVKVFALPLTKWRDNPATKVYDIQGAVRIRSSGLRAGLLMRIVTAQVDESWKPNSCAVLTFAGRDAMLLVPANPYWCSQVEGEK